jgi:hypothetical protein
MLGFGARPLLQISISIIDDDICGKDVPSAPRNSRTPLRRTASPSADLENGVLPAPLSWIS